MGTHKQSRAGLLTLVMSICGLPTRSPFSSTYATYSKGGMDVSMSRVCVSYMCNVVCA